MVFLLVGGSRWNSRGECKVAQAQLFLEKENVGIYGAM